MVHSNVMMLSLPDSPFQHVALLLACKTKKLSTPNDSSEAQSTCEINESSELLFPFALPESAGVAPPDDFVATLLPMRVRNLFKKIRHILRLDFRRPEQMYR